MTESRNWRFASLGILYIAQGLPFGLFAVALPSWFASQQFDPAQIGIFIFIANLPWSFKLLAGPVMDRFSYPAMGRRRPWVMGAQISISAAFLLLAIAPDPKSFFYITAGLGFLINLCASTQDVAVDGMAIDVLPVGDRARANAFMFGGQLLGISVGTSGGGYALNQMGLSGVAFLGTAATLAIFLVPLLVRERVGERLLPWSSGQASQHALDLQVDRLLPLMKSGFVALVAPVSLLLIVVETLTRVSDGLLFTMLPVYTVQELGWDDVVYNDWYALGSLIAAAIGLLVSPAIDKYGAKWALALAAIVKVAGMLLVGLAFVSNDDAMVGLVMVGWICSHISLIAIIVVMMRVCRAQVAATQFAVYMALSNLAYAGGSLLYAGLQVTFSATGLLVWSSAMLLLALPVWWYVGRRYL